MQSVSSALQEVMCESKPNELRGSTPEAAMSKVDEDVETYINRYKKAFEDNENIISDAMEKSTQMITSSVTSVVTEQNCNSHPKDKFQSIADLRPKYLEKDANLLEVRSWIQQTKNCIEASYKESPPNKGIYKYMMPLLHHAWISSLQCIDPDNRA